MFPKGQSRPHQEGDQENASERKGAVTRQIHGKDILGDRDQALHRAPRLPKHINDLLGFLVPVGSGGGEHRLKFGHQRAVAPAVLVILKVTGHLHFEQNLRRTLIVVIVQGLFSRLETVSNERIRTLFRFRFGGL